MKRKLPIKLEVIILVLFSILGAFIIEAWKGDANPDAEKYVLYLYIDFLVLLSMIILIICKFVKIFKHKDEKSPNTLIPEDEKGYYSSGYSFFKKGLYKEAIEQYNIAIKIELECAGLYISRGIAYFKIVEYGKAILDFKKAIEIRPDYPNSYYNLGITYYNIKLFMGAIEAYSKAIELNPKYIEAYKKRSLAYAKIDEHEKATKDLTKSEELKKELELKN